MQQMSSQILWARCKDSNVFNGCCALTGTLQKGKRSQASAPAASRADGTQRNFQTTSLKILTISVKDPQEAGCSTICLQGYGQGPLCTIAALSWTCQPSWDGFWKVLLLWTWSPGQIQLSWARVALVRLSPGRAECDGDCDSGFFFSPCKCRTCSLWPPAADDATLAKLWSG